MTCGFVTHAVIGVNRIMINNKRRIELTDVGFDGLLFVVIPLISMDMDATQIKAELKLANNKLDDKINKWNSQFTKKSSNKNAIERVKDVINITLKHSEKIKTTIVLSSLFENEVRNKLKLYDYGCITDLINVFGINVIIDKELKEDFILI